MNKKNFFTIISVLIASFIISMSFILDIYSVKIIAIDSLILYIILKTLYFGAFILIIILGLRNNDIANYIIQYIITVAFQIIPLAIRYLSIVENGFLISFIISLVSLPIYSGIIFGFSILSKRTLNTAKELEGTKIPVNKEDY